MSTPSMPIRMPIFNTNLAMQVVRTWRAEFPRLRVGFQMVNNHLLLSGSVPPFTVLSQRVFPQAIRFVSVELSSFENPLEANRLVSRLLSINGVHPVEVNNRTPEIAFKIQSLAAVAMRGGLTSIELVIRLDIQYCQFYDEDAAFSVAVTESMNDAADQAVHGLRSSNSIDQIEDLVHKYRVERWDSETECVICFENFGGEEMEEEEEVIFLACSHLFHGACIRRWLLESNTCPLCRSLIV